MASPGHAARPLKLGVAKVDITPPYPVRLAGYEKRQGVFDRIADPLFLRVLLLEQAASGGPPQRVLLVSADVIWWGPERVAPVLSRLKKQWDLMPEDVILHATHTHSAPQTSNAFVSLIGVADQGYLALLERKLLEAIQCAAANLETVRAERGRGVCRIGVNRRKAVDGVILPAPDPDGPLDPEVTCIQFRTARDTTKALLVHYACHPTTTDANQVSAEFPGVAMALLEQHLGGEAIAAYLQGCCGDVRPALVRDELFYYGDAEAVMSLGSQLAQAALNVLAGPLEPLGACMLAGRQATVVLEVRSRPTLAELIALQDEPGLAGAWSRLLLDDPSRLSTEVPLRLGLVNLAAGLSLLVMDAEITAAYGLWIKERFGGAILPLGYSNGMIGYVPTAAQVLEGGYEARESCPYFGLPGPFAASLEGRIQAAIQELAGY